MTSQSIGQTCCSAGAPISTSLDIISSDSSSFSIQLEYLYNSVNSLVAENQILRNDPRKRSGQTAMIKVDYNLNKHFSFSAFIPYVVQQRKTISDEEQASGIGDLTLLAQYTIRRKPSIDKIVRRKQGIGGISIGVKVPTSFNYQADERGTILSPDMQSGTGTFDFIGRAFYQRTGFLTPNLTNINSVSFKYNGTNDHFGDQERIGGRQFKFGNELVLKTHFYFNTLLSTIFVTPDLGLQLRVSEANQEEGSISSNSGGQWFSIPFGLGINVNESSNIRLFGELPIWQNLDGTQITTNYKVGIQFRYLINT